MFLPSFFLFFFLRLLICFRLHSFYFAFFKVQRKKHLKRNALKFQVIELPKLSLLTLPDELHFISIFLFLKCKQFVGKSIFPVVA